MNNTPQIYNQGMSNQQGNNPHNPVSALMPLNQGGQLPSIFQGYEADNSLGAGIASSFGLIGYKGKVWSLRYRGDVYPLYRYDQAGHVVGAEPSIEVVIVGASRDLSKIYYANGYVEGNTDAPDCFSNNGIRPEPSSKNLQNQQCANCRWNAWGSRPVVAGRASNGKACADSKRLAVVPLQDPLNEQFGGPLLLRVPPASLNDVAAYGEKLKGLGYPEFAVATRIMFDYKEAYPKFIFSAIRVLTEQEALIVMEHRKGDAIKRVLSEAEYDGQAQQATTPEQVFEQPPQGQPQQGGYHPSQNPQPGIGQGYTQPVQHVERTGQPSQPAHHPMQQEGQGTPVQTPASTFQPNASQGGGAPSVGGQPIGMPSQQPVTPQGNGGGFSGFGRPPQSQPQNPQPGTGPVFTQPAQTAAQTGQSAQGHGALSNGSGQSTQGHGQASNLSGGAAFIDPSQTGQTVGQQAGTQQTESSSGVDPSFEKSIQDQLDQLMAGIQVN